MTYQQKNIIRHSKKLEDSVDLKKVQEKDWQYLVEKLIDHTENKNSSNDLTEKEAEIFAKIETNYKISRGVYGSLYYDIAENFKRYIESLDFIEKQALNINIRANGGGRLPIENYSDSVELLRAFEFFSYINGRLPFTNGLLTIPDGDFPKIVGEQKISTKSLYKRFRGTHSHGLSAVPFSAALNLFFASDPKL